MGRMFEKRKATIFKRNARVAKAFTRISKEIVIAVKSGGPDPSSNPSLRRAVQNARSANMPKDKVESAIARASGEGAEDYQELVYEGYGPHGVAILVETATDNPTRTVANVRSHFKKGNGNMGNSGSVAYMFEKQGVFKLRPDSVTGDVEELELELIDFGLESLETDTDADDDEEVLVLRCAFNDFGDLQGAIEERGIEPKSSGAQYTPQNVTELGDAEVEDVLALIERLEEDDDVQNVYHTLA